MIRSIMVLSVLLLTGCPSTMAIMEGLSALGMGQDIAMQLKGELLQREPTHCELNMCFYPGPCPCPPECGCMAKQAGGNTYTEGNL